MCMLACFICMLTLISCLQETKMTTVARNSGFPYSEVPFGIEGKNVPTDVLLPHVRHSTARQHHLPTVVTCRNASANRVNGFVVCWDMCSCIVPSHELCVANLVFCPKLQTRTKPPAPKAIVNNSQGEQVREPRGRCAKQRTHPHFVEPQQNQSQDDTVTGTANQ